MHHEEYWQIYEQNGTPIPGPGATETSFTQASSLVMGNAHVWLWKKTSSGVEVLLQRRSLTHKRHPGRYHVSAAGHIDAGETSVETAIRETYEELGIVIDTKKLFFAGSMRKFALSPNNIISIFLYQLDDTVEFNCAKDEVHSCEWRTVTNIEEIIREPDNNNFVDQGQLYFNTLLTALAYVSSANTTLS